MGGELLLVEYSHFYLLSNKIYSSYITEFAVKLLRKSLLSTRSKKDVENSEVQQKRQRNRKAHYKRPSYFGDVLPGVDMGTNAVGVVVFDVPGELGKLGRCPQSNEGAVDADADVSEAPVLRLSGTEGCFLCPPPLRRLCGNNEALGLKLSSGRLVQSSIDADDIEDGEGGDNAGNAEG